MNSSVIITTYKRPDFLLRAVKSVLAQSVPTEVVVVDDNGLGTEDQLITQKVLKPFLDKITYLPLEKNSGACIARNEGVKVASGEYIFFLDDDDEFLPDKVKIQSAFLKNNKEYDGCLAAFKRIDDKEKKEILADANFPVVGDFRNFALHGNFFTPMLCIRRQAFRDSGGFRDIPRFQDRFFMMHALQQGLSFGVMADALHIMYEHSGNRLTSSSVGKTSEALRQINNFVLDYRDEFSSAEWQAFQRAQRQTLAVTKYNATKRNIRQSASLDYLQLFLSLPNLADFIMVFKSLVK